MHRHATPTIKQGWASPPAHIAFIKLILQTRWPSTHHTRRDDLIAPKRSILTQSSGPHKKQREAHDKCAPLLLDACVGGNVVEPDAAISNISRNSGNMEMPSCWKNKHFCLPVPAANDNAPLLTTRCDVKRHQNHQHQALNMRSAQFFQQIKHMFDSAANSQSPH